MKIKPLGTRVLIEPFKPSEKTKGGIILPDQAKQEKAEGIVIAVGPDTMHLEEGDHVVFAKYAGDELTYNGSECKIIDEDDVIATIEGAK